MLSCVWLFCDPMDCSTPDSSVHGISQARILEWFAISLPRGSFQPSWPLEDAVLMALQSYILDSTEHIYYVY